MLEIVNYFQEIKHRLEDVDTESLLLVRWWLVVSTPDLLGFHLNTWRSVFVSLFGKGRFSRHSRPQGRRVQTSGPYLFVRIIDGRFRGNNNGFLTSLTRLLMFSRMCCSHNFSFIVIFFVIVRCLIIWPFIVR